MVGAAFNSQEASKCGGDLLRFVLSTVIKTQYAWKMCTKQLLSPVLMQEASDGRLSTPEFCTTFMDIYMRWGCLGARFTRIIPPP